MQVVTFLKYFKLWTLNILLYKFIFRSKENLESLRVLVPKILSCYTTNKSESSSNIINEEEPEYFNDTAESFPETLQSSKAVSKFCNYFDTTESWRNFLMFNFIFLYLLPIVIMSTSYGLIIKKVCKLCKHEM